MKYQDKSPDHHNLLYPLFCDNLQKKLDIL
jgi:hypothetical protein